MCITTGSFPWGKDKKIVGEEFKEPSNTRKQYVKRNIEYRTRVNFLRGKKKVSQVLGTWWDNVKIGS